MANEHSNLKWILPIVLSSLFGIGMMAWGVYERAGNSQHTAIEHRIDRVEKAVEAIPTMQTDIAVIRQIIEGMEKK